MNVVVPLKVMIQDAQSPSERPPVGFGREALTCKAFALPVTGSPSRDMKPETGVDVGVGVNVADGLDVGVGVRVAEGVALGDGVALGVADGVAEGVPDGVPDGLGVGFASIAELHVPENVSSTVPSELTNVAS